MPRGARLRAIVPKKTIDSVKVASEVRKWFEQVAADFKKEMQKYPPKLPSKTGYKRTFRYKRGWNNPPIYTQATVTVINPVPYSRYVGGPIRTRGGTQPTQARHMAARGWPSQTHIGPMVIRRNLKDLPPKLRPFKKL